MAERNVSIVRNADFREEYKRRECISAVNSRTIEYKFHLVFDDIALHTKRIEKFPLYFHFIYQPIIST